ncbi:hypothetical protein MMC11_006716 [Xylographa trunciseda]|nr:hypothetical protein [Xylographa trunciseda]
MTATHGPIECVKSIQDKHPDYFANMGFNHRIPVAQSRPPIEYGGQEATRPLDAVSAQKSTCYVTAVQLVDRLVLMDDFSITNLESDALCSLTHKSDCVWNQDFDGKGKGRWRTLETISFEDWSPLVDELPNQPTIAIPLPIESIKSN